jgi:hypothetical protein
MALSMDEQRMLAEIERRLAAEDPGLASRLSSFRRRSGPAGLRTPRGRIVLLVSTLALVAVISAVMYLMVPFRLHTGKAPSNQQSSSAPAAIVSGNEHTAP